MEEPGSPRVLSHGSRGAGLRSVKHMLRTRTLLLMMATLVAVLGGTLPGLSSASFTSQTTNTGSTFAAAADWTPPTVTMTSPGSAVSGTATVSATASDADSGLASVLIEYLAPNASSWTSLCTATSSPWSCSWDTTKVADGSYSLRATATDKAGNTAVSDPVTTTVANNLTVVLADPGSYVRGSAPLSGAIYGGGGTSYTVTIEYLPAGSTSWKTLCTSLLVTSTFGCTWLTTGYPNGSYDLRATATAGRTSATSNLVSGTMVDNTAPAVTMTDPGTPLSGTVTLAAAASDADSGVNQIVVQYAVGGLLDTWTTACTLTASPYSCRFDTTRLTDGSYSFRAVATDAAGNGSTSASVTGRTVDNSVSSVSMEDPGAYLSGTVTLAASASAGSGVRSVVIQRAPSGGSTWTTVCTIIRATTPYSCPFDTTAVADGLYDLRAALTDGNGKVTTSATLAARRVDNTALRGYDIQATNGAATLGRIEANDSLTLTYTDTVKPSSISAGFTGAALSVQVRVRDGGVLGLSAKDDTLDVLVGGVVVNLGSVDLKEDFVKNGKTVLVNATMTATTVASGAANRTVVTLKLTSITSGASSVRTVSSAQPMVWSPSTSATDPYGTACSGAPVTELGTLDKDF